MRKYELETEHNLSPISQKSYGISFENSHSIALVVGNNCGTISIRIIKAVSKKAAISFLPHCTEWNICYYICYLQSADKYTSHYPQGNGAYTTGKKI